MQTVTNGTGGIVLSMRDLRGVTGYAAESVQEALEIFERAHPANRCGEGRDLPTLHLLPVCFISALRSHQRRLLEDLETEASFLDTDHHLVAGAQGA